MSKPEAKLIKNNLSGSSMKDNFFTKKSSIKFWLYCKNNHKDWRKQVTLGEKCQNLKIYITSIKTS